MGHCKIPSLKTPFPYIFFKMGITAASGFLLEHGKVCVADGWFWIHARYAYILYEKCAKKWIFKALYVHSLDENVFIDLRSE